MNARAALDLAMRKVDLLDVGTQAGIFSAMLARLPAFPGIIATLGDLKCLAAHRDRVVMAVLGQERKAKAAGCARRCPALFLEYHAPDAGSPPLAQKRLISSS